MDDLGLYDTDGDEMVVSFHNDCVEVAIPDPDNPEESVYGLYGVDEVRRLHEALGEWLAEWDS